MKNLLTTPPRVTDFVWLPVLLVFAVFVGVPVWALLVGSLGLVVLAVRAYLFGTK